MEPRRSHPDNPQLPLTGRPTNAGPLVEVILKSQGPLVEFMLKSQGPLVEVILKSQGPLVEFILKSQGASGPAVGSGLVEGNAGGKVEYEDVELSGDVE
jgi:hypothetical protein